MRRPFVDALGTRTWFRRSNPHRLQGPAIERTDGTKDWLRAGVRHREDGPATEDHDLSWFVFGMRLVCCDRSDEFGSSVKRTMFRMIEEYGARR